MKIIKALEEDKYFLAEVCKDAAWVYKEIMPGAFEKQGKRFIEEGLTSHYKIELLKLDNEKIGFVGTKVLDETTLYLTALYFLNKYQRQGYGEGVLKIIENRAKEKAIKEILILVHKEATWATNFYEKNNYKRITNEKELSHYASKMANYLIPSTLLMRKNLCNNNKK